MLKLDDDVNVQLELYRAIRISARLVPEDRSYDPKVLDLVAALLTLAVQVARVAEVIPPC